MSIFEYQWPFPSPEPSNVETLLVELASGVQVEGDHSFYFWNNQKRRHIRNSLGRETVLARHIVWWMYGKTYPKTANGLTTNCGEDKCLNINHLILKVVNIPHGPEKKCVPAPAKPSKPYIPHEEHDDFDHSLHYDRTSCISCKAYFKDERTARKEVRELNNRRGGRKRLFAYPCDLIGCGGWHLTKVNPKKYNKQKNKGGSW